MANDSREVDCQVDLHGHQTVSTLIHPVSMAESDTFGRRRRLGYALRIGCVAGAPVADRSALLYCGSVQQSKAAPLARQKRDEREYLEVEPLMVT